MSYSPADLQRSLDLANEHIKSVSYTAPSARTVVVLASAASWVTKSFENLPRIQVTGAYGSGKSTLFSAIQPLVQNPVRNSGQLSTTFAYRNDFRSAAMDGEVPTSLVDETKHIFGENGKRGGQHPLYAIATEGYSRYGAPVRYQEKDMNVSYSCYQVMFLGGRGEMSLPEDVLDRAIRLVMSKKPDGMQLERIGDPTIVANGQQAGAYLSASVRAAQDTLTLLARDTDWYAKAGLDSRMADIWIPLFTIAEAAGGPWPSLVQSAYAELGSKTSRNLPTLFQLKVDTLAFINGTGCEPHAIPAAELIGYLQELGRKSYNWDDVPFSLKRFGMTLKAAGLNAHKSNSVVYYQASEAWLKEADELANPVSVSLDDPENDWSVLDEFVE